MPPYDPYYVTRTQEAMSSSPASAKRTSQDASPSNGRADLANGDDPPWYASLDSMPDSHKFNSGHLPTSAGHGFRRRNSSMAHSEVEKVKQEEVDVADDIPAVWPTESEGLNRPRSQPREDGVDQEVVNGVPVSRSSEHDHTQSNPHHRCPTAGIPIAQMHNHYGREVSKFETPTPTAPASHYPPRQAERRSVSRRSSLEHELLFPVEVGQPTQRQKSAAFCSRPGAAPKCGVHAGVTSGGGKPEVCHCWNEGTDW